MLAVPLVAASCLAMSFPAMAAESIGEIYLDISSSIEAGSSGGDVSVDVDDDGYDVEDVEITNEPSGEWDDGDKPRIRVTLSADDDYYFSSGIDEDDVDLSGDGGSVTDVSRSSRETLRVYITLSRLDGDDDDAGEGDGHPRVPQDLEGFLRIVDDEAQNAELGGIRQGEGADIDLVLPQDRGNLGQAAGFVLDKNRDLLNRHGL